MFKIEYRCSVWAHEIVADHMKMKLCRFIIYVQYDKDMINSCFPAVLVKGMHRTIEKGTAAWL